MRGCDSRINARTLALRIQYTQDHQISHTYTQSLKTSKKLPFSNKKDNLFRLKSTELELTLTRNLKHVFFKILSNGLSAAEIWVK